jgi:uncharacterized membrane protein
MIRKEWFIITILVLFVATAIAFGNHAMMDASGQVIVARTDAGEPILSLSKFAAIYLIPLVAVILYAIMYILSNIAVYKPHLDNFFEKFFGFKLLLVLLLYVVYGTIILSNFNLDFKNTLVIVVLAVAFWYIGHLFHHAKHDDFAPWIRGKSKLWYDSHHLGTWSFRICSIITLFAVAFPQYLIVFLTIPVIVTCLMIILYGIVIFKKEHHLR